jgi:hypothetical protein
MTGSYESFYDDETKELVTKIFNKDFEIYKYDKGVVSDKD